VSGPPSFRTVKGGYDPDEVDAHLTRLQEHRVRLEHRLAEVEVRITAFERLLAGASDESPAEDLDLIGVIQQGERQGEAILAQAIDDVARVWGQADARIAVLEDRTEVARLTEAVAQGRRHLSELQAARAAAIEDLESVHDGLESTREAAVAGLDEVLDRLAELAELVPTSRERT
jgi:chromosome segregation ATPase